MADFIPEERVTNTKMFAPGGDRFPIRLFKLYLSGTNHSSSLSIQTASSLSNVENKPTYVFHGGTVTCNNIVKTENKKRKYVIYDSESSQSQ